VEGLRQRPARLRPRPGPETSRTGSPCSKGCDRAWRWALSDWPFPSGRDQGRLRTSYRSMNGRTLTPTERRTMNSKGTGMCPHTPPCPAPSAPDREAAHTIVNHPEGGWSLLCNGVVIFEDTGELLPGGAFIAPTAPPTSPPPAVRQAWPRARRAGPSGLIRHRRHLAESPEMPSMTPTYWSSGYSPPSGPRTTHPPVPPATGTASLSKFVTLREQVPAVLADRSGQVGPDRVQDG